MFVRNARRSNNVTQIIVAIQPAYDVVASRWLILVRMVRHSGMGEVIVIAKGATACYKQ